MSPAEPLGRGFFAREPDVVARDLLGCVIATELDGGRVAVRLTETEAYQGADDAASHAFRGETARTAVMFGPAGHLYLYFVYGMHWCANVVTGRPGAASAVLLRAGEVVDGLATAQGRRPAGRHPHKLASGPARLASVLGWGSGEVARTANGGDLCAPGRARVGVPGDDAAGDRRGRPAGRRGGRHRGAAALLDRRRPDGQRLPTPGSPDAGAAVRLRQDVGRD